MRVWILGGLLLWLCPVLIVGARGAGLPIAAAIPAGVIASAAAAFLITPRLFRAIALPLSSSLPLRLALGAFAALAIVRIASLSMFMADVRLTERSLKPDDPYRTRHSCMTSYAEAARLIAEGGHNIYDAGLYEPRFIGPLKVDRFHYPPPFLLIPQAIHTWTGDFLSFRALWFALQGLALAGTILVVAGWIGGMSGAVALTGGAALLASPSVLFGLQQGNFQLTAAPLAVVSMILLSGRHVPSGAMLLAYAAAAKIFPGILVVYLAAARRWRAVGWTAACGIVLLALTLAAQGTGPTVDFVTHALPEISSGAAFPHTEVTRSTTMNWTIYGMTVRLRRLGLSWLDQPAGLTIASIYGILVIGLAAWVGWRSRAGLEGPARRLALLQLTLALVALASFRSPFAGAPYGSMSALWLMTLLAAGASAGWRAATWIAGMVALSVTIWSLPSPSFDPTVFTMVFSGILFCLTVLLCLWTVWRAASAPAIASAEPAEPMAAAALR